MTRELKLALIVGFALVLVVTVLISDHLSHARQTRLATLPTEPAKVTEPPPIALESGAGTLPQAAVTEPQPNAPAPLIGSMPTTEPDPVVLVQGTPRPTGPTGPTNPAAPIDLINPHPQTTAPAPLTGHLPAGQPIAGTGTLDEVVRSAGGQIVGDTAFIPGVQTRRESLSPSTINTALPQNAADPALPRAAQPSASPLTTPVVPPAPADRIHTVAGGEHLFKICKAYYGDGKAWRKLAKYNGIDAGTPLKIGQKLRVPTSEVLLGKPAAAPPAVITSLGSGQVTPIASNTGRVPVVEPRPQTPDSPSTPAAGGRNETARANPVPRTRPYTIKKGDSLAAIAQRELGTVKRAREIVELNRKVIKNPDNVPLGATIQLPAA